MSTLTSIVQNSQNVETAQMSINWWMSKQNVVYPCNAIWFSNKKEWKTDIHQKLDQLRKHAE
jgi:hypothetical protein